MLNKQMGRPGDIEKMISREKGLKFMITKCKVLKWVNTLHVIM